MNYHHKGQHDSSGKASFCCDDCEPRHPVRNHYFTGKLLVERDFTDEQAYIRQKLRLHHQRLHGAGIVCGLDLVQHPNPACRDRLMVLDFGKVLAEGDPEKVLESEEVIRAYIGSGALA